MGLKTESNPCQKTDGLPDSKSKTIRRIIIKTIIKDNTEETIDHSIEIIAAKIPPTVTRCCSAMDFNKDETITITPIPIAGLKSIYPMRKNLIFLKIFK